MNSKQILKGSLALLVLSLTLPFYSAQAASKEVEAVEPQVASVDKDSGVTVYRDAAGGFVFSGLEVPFTATEEQQAEQKATIEKYSASEDLTKFPGAFAASEYVDYESNPIYIGTWNNIPAYARHTLGAYSSTLSYLTSYGYTSWYNTSGNTALPYRNGATNNGANQGVVDVAKFSYFDVRDIGTNNVTSLQITDWGPDQKAHPDRIADLDKNDFASLHGSSGAGLFYSRTWVPIKNYNP
ncbi:hypothetical protein [Paenibacillus zanthoxyli]|uniref:hypothetical protein n=1 Tax=Paenibacillus zanthoxyli TaxID=369399 RepID=UPI000471DE62|nr:hypothetical protein [Paenibacillus zanthoxyli]